VFEFTWDVDPIAIELGPIQIRWYGLLFLGVFLGGYALFRWQVKRGGGSEDDATDIFIPAIVGVLVGARLGHVIFYAWDQAIRDPIWIFKIWEGGLASHGATIGLLLALWWYARRHRQATFEVLDRFAWSAALGATLVRLGNFVNSEIVGHATDQTWGVRFPRKDGYAGMELLRGVDSPSGLLERLQGLLTNDWPLQTANLAPLRHPTQLYEFGMGLLVMGILTLVDRALGREKRPRGVLISTFFVAYFIGRFLVEFLKEEQAEALAGAGWPITMGQILSIPMALLGAGVLVWCLRRNQPAGWNIAPAAADRTPDRAARRRQQRGRRRK